MHKLASMQSERILHNNQHLQEVITQSEQQLTTQTHQYEIPLYLCQSYMSTMSHVEVYENHIVYEDSSPLQMGFMTSMRLSDVEDISFCYGDQMSRVRIHSSPTSTMLTIQQFEQIFEFNVYLGAEWFKVAQKNVQQSKRPMKDYLRDQDKPFRTYLFFLGDDRTIDINRMIHFVYQRLGEYAGPCLFNKYIEAKDKSMFKQYCQQNIFYSEIHKTVYSVHYIINNIWQRGISEFFDMLRQLSHNEIPLEQMLEYFDLSALEYDLLRNQKIGFLLYTHKFASRVATIDALRDNIKKYQDSKEYKQKQKMLRQLNTCPLAIVEYTQSIRTLSLSSDSTTQQKEKEKEKEKEHQVRKLNFKLKKPSIQLVPIIQLHQMMLNVDQMSHTCHLPMIMLMVEKQIICRELQMAFNFTCSPQYLTQAIQSCSYNATSNYEVLECVGDSILKYLVSLALHQQFGPRHDESYLTNKRVEFINNKFLGVLAVQSKLHYYVKIQITKYGDWTFPPLISVDQNKDASTLITHKQQITLNQMADVYEAIIGAIFVSTYTFNQPMQFLSNTFNPIGSLDNKYLDGPFLIDNQMQQEYSLDASYLDLVGSMFDLKDEDFKSIQLLKRDYLPNKTNNFNKWLMFFQNQILGYQFKNVDLLIEALTFQVEAPHKSQKSYQNLEYLGDAVLECFIVGNIYHLFGNMKVTPFLMHKVKLLLLTNQFMAKVAILKGFHIFILNMNIALTQEINLFAFSCDFKSRFNRSPAGGLKCPKPLSDVWESVCGALLIDGGWQAVTQTYGNFYRPFFVYTVKHIYDIEQPAMDRLQLYASQQNKDLRTDFNYVGGKFHVQVIYDNIIIGLGSDCTEQVARDLASTQACELLNI